MANVPSPSKLTDPKRVRQMMKNAEEHGEQALVLACRRRLYELAGVNYDDPVERRLWQAVAALEETLRDKHGHGQPAGYTRRKIKEAGAIATLSDWALKTTVTPGFIALVEAGMPEFTGEYVVAEYPDRFGTEVVEAARRRLLKHGVPLPPVTT